MAESNITFTDRFGRKISLDEFDPEGTQTGRCSYDEEEASKLLYEEEKDRFKNCLPKRICEQTVARASKKVISTRIFSKEEIKKMNNPNNESLSLRLFKLLISEPDRFFTNHSAAEILGVNKKSLSPIFSYVAEFISEYYDPETKENVKVVKGQTHLSYGGFLPMEPARINREFLDSRNKVNREKKLSKPSPNIKLSKKHADEIAEHVKDPSSKNIISEKINEVVNGLKFTNTSGEPLAIKVQVEVRISFGTFN